VQLLGAGDEVRTPGDRRVATPDGGVGERADREAASPTATPSPLPRL
jgi:hypothetical protein